MYYPHGPDHVIAEKHGGPASLENLAWACFHCNRRITSREIVPAGQIFPHFLPSRGRSLPLSPVAFARISGNGEGPALRDPTEEYGFS